MNAKIIDFYSWQLPLYYSTPVAEHNTVRKSAGLFDTSHMGEIQIEGKDAENLLQLLLIRDISKMKPGQMRLAVMCNLQGCILDDLTVYKFSEEKFWVVVNGSQYEKDFSWIQENARHFDVKVSGLRSETAKLDLQGPRAELILQGLAEENLSEIKYYQFKELRVSGIPCVVSRSGYTGEDGFELYFSGEKATGLWNALLKAGKQDVLLPCGLAARDTLRLEAGMLLYGADIDEKHSLLQSPYKKLINWEKQFLGKEELEKQRSRGTGQNLVGFELAEKGIARQGHHILNNSQEIGVVTSGSFSPTLKKSIGLGYIGSEFSEPGKGFEVDIRGKKVKAKVVETPFYKR